jgi:hypothetical protein
VYKILAKKAVVKTKNLFNELSESVMVYFNETLKNAQKYYSRRPSMILAWGSLSYLLCDWHHKGSKAANANHSYTYEVIGITILNYFLPVGGITL